MTAFQHSYYLPRKFNVDQRNNSLSASVRSGLLTRDEALELYKAPPYLEEELLEYFIKRMKMTEEEFDIIMHLPLKSYRDYKTYKKTFEKMKPLFWLLQKFNLVPRSFYIKYTSKSEL
jgi:hypothetical protein